MPTPKPLPPSKLRSQTSSSASSGTMRLVQPRKSISQSQHPSFSGDAYDLPLRGEGGSAVIEDWDTALGRSHDNAMAEVGWQELGSQSNETVLVTVRYVPFSSCSHRGSESNVSSIRIRPLSSAQPHDANAWSTPVDAGYPLPRTIRLADGTRKEWSFGTHICNPRLLPNLTTLNIADQILPPNTTNHQAYLCSALPHVRSAMQGYNAVCFAYGQTGSGKSHTMTGTPAAPGVVPLAVEEIFQIIRKETDREWVLRASYLELYNETLVDLLTPAGSGAGEIQILNGKKEGEVQINGLTEMIVTNVAEVKKVLNIGDGRRRTGCTDWNERSSRSHSVFRVVSTVVKNVVPEVDPCAAGHRVSIEIECRR